MKWSLISAVNNDGVLKSCLLNSSESQSASETLLQTGFASAAAAYNDAIEKSTTDVLVFAHQDVYLPEGWASKLQDALETVSKQDPEWGVLGVWGLDATGQGVGDVFCTFAMRRLGGAFAGVMEVRTLDEVMLIVRKSSGLRFDEQMKGFHLYATDICLQARKRGMKCYAISAFCVHNTNGYLMLPLEFWKYCLFIRKKWKAELPIFAPCAKITFWCWPMIKWNIIRALNIMLKRLKPGKRLPDPARLYREELAPERAALPAAHTH
jgi:hypothetical protein